MMLMLRKPLEPPEITDEIRARFETVDEAEVLSHAETVTAVVTKGDLGLPGELMARLKALRMIAVYGVGVERIDLDQARDRGIAVTTTPDVLTDAVAEHAIALMLALTRRVVEGDGHVRSGAWASSKLGLSRSLRGQTLGVLGYGRIGRRIAELAGSLGMNVIYTGRSPVAGKEAGFRATPQVLAREADVLVVAAAGGSDTIGLVDASVLNALGAQGLLINVARGSLVVEDDLVAALRSGTILGAALDVFDDEPTPRKAFSELTNTVLTPHIASATLDARRDMGRLVIENLAAFYGGRPLVTPLEF